MEVPMKYPLFVFCVYAFLSISGSCKSEAVTVAVIDTGVDIYHPHLKDKIDNRYWSFSDNSSDVSDNHGHGTHIAGIIAKLSPQTKILPIKYWDPSTNATDPLTSLVKSINFAVSMKVDIINVSLGGYEASASEFEALKNAEKNNILVIAAAGNDGLNLNKSAFYPASYNLKNIVTVSSIDKNGKRLPSSNYGNLRELQAPGAEILSTLPNKKIGSMTGTSQAAAYATGLISKMLLKDIRLKNKWINNFMNLKRALVINSK